MRLSRSAIKILNRETENQRLETSSPLKFAVLLFPLPLREGVGGGVFQRAARDERRWTRDEKPEIRYSGPSNIGYSGALRTRAKHTNTACIENRKIGPGALTVEQHSRLLTKYSAAEKSDPLSGGLQSLLFHFRQHFVERAARPIERLGVTIPLRDELHDLVF